MFSAAVLAGGRSSRFGCDKAVYEFRGKPLMQWVLDSLAEASEHLIIANKPYPEFGVPVFSDLTEHAGPLSGLHTALYYAKHEWVAVAACDLPHLKVAYWQILLEHRSNVDAVVIRRNGILEPLAALYHRNMLPKIEVNLFRKELAIHPLLNRSKIQCLNFEDLNLANVTLMNMNYPTDTM